MKASGRALVCLFVCLPLFGQNFSTSSPSSDKPRVFITDSQSWEISGGGGGANGNWGAATRGGARPQTAEIIKTFGERCPQVIPNNKPDIADYVVLLDHEGGKGLLRHKNKVAVFQKISGDVVISHSTLSLGGSVQDACEGIVNDWVLHGTQIRAAAKPAPVAASGGSVVQASGKSSATTVTPPKINVTSTPDASDIEIDGSFVGNTPSIIELAPGEHVVLVKKAGYKVWQRKLKVTGGEIKLNAELEK